MCRSKKFAFLAALLAVSHHAVAGDEVRLKFIPPPMAGTISMGVYDRGGRLVRMLHREAQIADFVVDIDGLITKWNGKDDSGKSVVPGKYTARGYVVGEFNFEGQAFHCNDWITEDSSPRIRRVLNASALPDRGLILLVQTGGDGRALLRCDAEGSMLWNHPLPEDFGGQSLVVNGASAFVGGGHQIAQFELKGGTGSFWEQKFAAIGALAADDGSLLVADGAKIIRYKLGDRSVAGDYAVESAPHSLAMHGNNTAAVVGGRLLVREGNIWRAIELGPGGPARAVQFNRDDSLWLIVGDDKTGEVREYSLAGEFRRRLGIKPDEPVPVALSASADGDQIFLLEQNGRMQRLRGLTLVGTDKSNGKDAATSKWRIDFSREIWFSDDLKQVADQLTTASRHKFEPQEKVRIKLRPNPLNQDKPAFAEISVGMDTGGSFLRLADGLPLRSIADTRNLRAVAMMAEPDSESVTIFQSDGAVVEEFTASKLENMMAFDCGEFEYPEKPAPPADDDSQ